jgi:hypothetical protein
VVSAGGNHSCTVMNTGTSIFSLGKVRCWGWGDAGQLGYGNTSEIGNNETPASAGNVPLL